MPKQHSAFISGAGRNIGRAVAMELGRRGCNIVINGSSNRANCDAVAAQVKALGVEAVVLMGDVGQADELEHVVDSPAVDAVGVGQPAQVVAGAAPRVDGLGLEEGTDMVQGEAEIVIAVAVNGDPTGGRSVETDHHPHGGRLAGSVGAEEASDFPGPDLEAEAIDRDGCPVALGDVVDLDHRIRRQQGRWRAWRW